MSLPEAEEVKEIILKTMKQLKGIYFDIYYAVNFLNHIISRQFSF